MKYANILGLLAVAALSLMVFAATASATIVTSNGSSYTGIIEAESEGATTLDGIVDLTCNKSTLKGSVESHGSLVTAEVHLSSLTLTECNVHMAVEVEGALVAHATSNGNATATSNGAVILLTITSLGLTCEYTTSNTDIGTLTGSETTNGNATLDLEGSAIPRTGGSIFCGSSAEWTGSFKITTPSNLNLD